MKPDFQLPTTPTSTYEWTPGGPRPLGDLLDALERQRAAGRRIVTTNGCFDLLHVGHVRFLSAARALGDLLVVGLNSDASVRRLKGAGRPVVAEADRAAMLAALRPVDHVVVFDDLLPNDTLAALRPAVHCKAGDYRIESLPEAEVVRRYGGEVRILPLAAGQSTSRLIERVLSAGLAQAAPAAPAGPSQPTPAIERLFDGANVLRQTAYSLRDDLGRAADLIARAIRSGHHVLIYDDETGGSERQHFAAQLLEWARRSGRAAPGGAVSVADLASIEEARPGDLALLIPPRDRPDLPTIVSAAQSRGMLVVALAGAPRPPSVGQADLWLRVPSDDQLLIQTAQVAVLGALSELLEQLLAQEHRHD
jgi:glycerol-3-phosphate cytidylyltransferase